MCFAERKPEERREGKREKNPKKKGRFENENGVEGVSAWVLENKLDLSLKSCVFWGFWVENTVESLEEAQGGFLELKRTNLRRALWFWG